MGDIDDGKCVRQTSDGGYIITGGAVPDGMISSSDVLLVKADEAGTVEWIKFFARNYYEEGAEVEQTSDEGYIIAGRSVFATDFFDYESDGWLIKTDDYGDTIWTKVVNGSGNDYFTSVQLTPDNGYIVAGSYNSEFCYPEYEVNELYEPGDSQAWLVKTDSNGEIQWTRTYLERSYGTCVRNTSDGGYIITGYIFPDESDNLSDVLLIKTDASGDTLWTRIFGGENSDIGLSVCETEDGYTISGQTKPVGSPYDALLIKTDLSGNVIWMNTYGGYMNDSGFSVAPTSDGGYFVTGTANGCWWVNGGDMWVFKVDSNGNLTWEQIFDFAICDYGRYGIQTSDLGYVVTGLVGYGFGGDLWLAKFAPEPSTVKNDPMIPIDFASLQAYPNPFNPTTTISYQLLAFSHVNLSVYDVTGREIAKLVDGYKSAGSYEVTFDASKLVSGVYFVRLTVDGGQTMVRKVVLMK